MKAKIAITVLLAVFICIVIAPLPVRGQAIKNRYELNLGAAFTQATTTNARTGLFGIDIFAGKMLTDNICLGFSVGHDIVSYRQMGDFHERLAIIPFQVKSKYFVTMGPMLQMYASIAGGVYRAVPHLNPEPIGGISYATNQAGGSAGFGVDYWFLLLQGVGVSFDYHFFQTDEEELFSYFVLRIDYCMLKF